MVNTILSFYTKPFFQKMSNIFLYLKKNVFGSLPFPSPPNSQINHMGIITTRAIIDFVTPKWEVMGIDLNK